MRPRALRAAERRGQQRLPYPEVAWVAVPRPPRAPLPVRPPPPAAVVVIQLDLPFDRPPPAASSPPRLRLLATVPAGGPDPKRPCEGCALRARCKAPCALLSALVPAEEATAWNEVSSPALMAGRGVDEAFMSMPAALIDDDPDELWPEVVAHYGGARLRGAMESLTPQQHDVLSLFLGGLSRAEIGVGRGTSRQATHKVFWAAIGRLARELGPLPDRVQRAARGRHEPEG